MKPWKRAGAVGSNGGAWLCFNGATAMKPWKSLAAVLLVYDPNALQWGQGDEAVEEGRPRQRPAGGQVRFNGATAMKPWKSSLGDLGLALGRQASMGPRR